MGLLHGVCFNEAVGESCEASQQSRAFGVMKTEARRLGNGLLRDAAATLEIKQTHLRRVGLWEGVFQLGGFWFWVFFFGLGF